MGETIDLGLIPVHPQEFGIDELPNGREKRLMRTPQANTVAAAIQSILVSCNADMTDPNFTETPERVGAAFVDYWLAGYNQNVEDVLTVFPNEGESDLVSVRDIPIHSMCAHHFAPFFGKAAIVYMPGDSVMGLSKTKRIIDVFARRLQLQEKITAQVADAIQLHLNPKGVLVVLYEIVHTCMVSRGVQAHGSTTTTQAARGAFATDVNLRNEAYRLIGL